MVSENSFQTVLNTIRELIRIPLFNRRIQSKQQLKLQDK